MAPAVQAFVQHIAEPAAPVHKPLLHERFGVVWKLQPLPSFEQVTAVVALLQVGPVVPVQTESVLHVQTALFAGPVQLRWSPQVAGALKEKHPLVPSVQVARPPLMHDFCPCVQVLVQVRPHAAFGALPEHT